MVNRDKYKTGNITDDEVTKRASHIYRVPSEYWRLSISNRDARNKGVVSGNETSYIHPQIENKPPMVDKMLRF